MFLLPKFPAVLVLLLAVCVPCAFVSLLLVFLAYVPCCLCSVPLAFPAACGAPCCLCSLMPVFRAACVPCCFCSLLSVVPATSVSLLLVHPAYFPRCLSSFLLLSRLLPAFFLLPASLLPVYPTAYDPCCLCFLLPLYPAACEHSSCALLLRSWLPVYL